MAKVKPIAKRSADSSTGVALTQIFDETIASMGYRTLGSCPEVVSAVDRIAQLGGLMTIHLMANSKEGDVRIRDELSKKIDINPYKDGTRSSFIQWIISTMMLGGDGNAFVLPVTKNGLLDDLKPMPPGQVSMIPEGDSYYVLFNGIRFAPDEVLHFRLRPDQRYPWRGRGYTAQLRDVLKTLAQANATKQGFMSSKWKPSVIVRVDADNEEFSSKAGRQKMLDDYIDTDEAGTPWIIPGDLMDIQQVKPLSLNDLAINDSVTLDKKTVASLLGVPAFVLGVGGFSKDEYNAFINTCLMPVMTGIQQELTKKLLISSSRYFRFNPRSLYAYSITELAAVAEEYYVRGMMTGNEARDWIGLTPKDGLDQLVMLENYIPAGMIGDQKKLIQNNKEDKNDDE